MPFKNLKISYERCHTFIYVLIFFLMSKNVDVISDNIDSCVRSIRIHSEEFRSNMNLSNEKDRSVGTIAEGISDGVEKAAQGQFTSVKTSLTGFATILSRVEYSRKSLYQRINSLAQGAFTGPAKSSINYSSSMKKREEAIKKLANLSPSATDQVANQVRLTASNANATAIQESRAWFGQYNTEMRRVFREYAHAQMEFAAKALEQWSCFMEDLALLDFNRDTDELVSMLEQTTVLQDSNAPTQQTK